MTYWERRKANDLQIARDKRSNTISLETISQVQLKVYETTVFRRPPAAGGKERQKTRTSE